MRHQVEEGQAKLSKLASPATGGVKKSSMARDEDTGAFSGRRNDPLRTSIPENMHMDEDPVRRFFEYQASPAASKVLSGYDTERLRGC